MRPIGVFDSGMGGLTVLAALAEQLPNESFVYLGDTARLPYGSKSAATVSRYAIQAAQHLHNAEVKLIVIACNTASAVALDELRAAFAPTPVIGVVQPGAAAASAACKHRDSGNPAGRRGVLVLATESTVRGGAYARAIQARDAALPVYSRACPLLVALAEEGRVDDAVVDLILQDYLAGYLAVDQVPQTLLLGCTHFPVFRRALQRLLPSGVVVVDSATTTAAAVAEHLEKTEPPNAAKSQSGTDASIQFLATDGVERFARVGRTFFGSAVTDVRLVDL